MAKDPVCGIDIGQAVTVGKSEYKGTVRSTSVLPLHVKTILTLLRAKGGKK